MHGLYDLQIVYTSLFQSAYDPYLKGLHRAMERVLPPADARAFAAHKQRVRVASSGEGFFQRLLARPLAPETVAYAADDVRHLFAMYAAWSPYVGERAVLAASLDRARQHTTLAMMRMASSSSGGYPAPFRAATVPPPHHNEDALTMARLDFRPVRRRRPCFVCTE